jgi:hypothetical protein
MTAGEWAVFAHVFAREAGVDGSIYSQDSNNPLILLTECVAYWAPPPGARACSVHSSERDMCNARISRARLRQFH